MKKGLIYIVPGLHTDNNFKYRYLGNCKFEIVSDKYPIEKPIIEFSKDFILKMEEWNEQKTKE